MGHVQRALEEVGVDTVLCIRDIVSVLGRPPQLQKKESRIPQSRCSGGGRVSALPALHTDTEGSTSSSITSEVWDTPSGGKLPRTEQDTRVRPSRN